MLERSHLLEYMIPRAPIHVIAHGDHAVLEPEHIGVFPDEDQLVRLGEGEWPQQHCVDQAEDRGICPYPQPQRQDRNRGEQRTLGKNAGGETEIVHEVASVSLDERIRSWLGFFPREDWRQRLVSGL